MRDVRIGATFLPFMFAFSGVIAVLGCAPRESDSASPLSNAELSSASAVFIESEQYQLKTVSTEPVKPPVEAARPEASLQKTPAKKKAKPKRKPVDIDFILTKSKDISVGVAMADSYVTSSRTQNETQTFVPASIVKLVTTAVALKVLGPEFRFSTRIYFELDAAGNASHVTLLADGDPTAGVTSYKAGAPNRMQDIALQLKSRGVRKILGEIQFLSADPRWDNAVLASGVADEDSRECYGAFVTSFNFRQNCAQALVYSNRLFQWESLGIENFVATRIETSVGSSNSLRLVPVISPDRRFDGYTLTGTYLAKKPRVLKYRLPIGNGVGFYAHQLRAALKSAGIAVDQATLNFSLSNEVRTRAAARFASESPNILQIDSASLAEIVIATNKSSDNFFADALFRMIGTQSASPSRVSRGAGVAETGKLVLAGFLSAWMKADGNPTWSEDFHIEEGAGLSANNRTTPRSLLALLRQFAKEPTFSSLWDSLSIAGQDGTLGDRMKNTRAVGRVRGKTGTLQGTYQVAGYVQRKNPNPSAGHEQYVPFVILTSTTAKNRDLVRRFQDALMVKIVEAVDRGETKD